LAVKGNQPTLRAAVEAVFDRACEAEYAGVTHDGHEVIEDGRGRHEERYTTVIYDPAGRPPDWPGAAAVAQVNRVREVGGVRTQTTHYYLSTHRGAAEELGRVVRSHWGIESMHWVLDVVYGEDDSRVREGHAGTNLGLVRRVAAALARRAPGKGSGVTKRKKAGWDDSYLLQVLQGIPAFVVR
jgi:predicted transposase YbfD/YdcC